MIYEELYLNLNYNQKVICAVVIVGLVILVQIIARIKNKAQKRTSKQVTCQRHKNAFSIDYDKFIRANFKKQEYLFENKNRLAELVRLVG